MKMNNVKIELLREAAGLIFFLQETPENLEYIALGDIPRDEAIAYTRYRLQGGPGKRHMRGGAKEKHNTSEHAGAVFSGGVAVAVGPWGWGRLRPDNIAVFMAISLK